MKVLVTGAKGFVGKNLCSQLNNIREGKARWYEGVQVDEVFEYDLGNTQEELDRFCAEADFVFNLVSTVHRIRKSSCKAISVLPASCLTH